MRGGTTHTRAHTLLLPFQSTRPVRGGTCTSTITFSCFLFQSTRPVRGGTPAAATEAEHKQISIHPPRAGRDKTAKNDENKKSYFNPPAPCGAGLRAKLIYVSCMIFQSTRPVRGGTAEYLADSFNLSISIHPPRAGRDSNNSQISLCDLLQNT